ncbi:MAG TPA: benzoate-CoA ligase family protein [Methylomirabilota bacterium]
MPNACVAFLDRHIRAGRGERPAIVTPTSATTYGELATRVARAAGALRALGVEPEQRVALLLGDGPEWATAFFAALRIGAVAVPLNTRLARDEWVAMLDDSRAKVLIADAPHAVAVAAVRERLPALRCIVGVGAGVAPSFASLIADAKAVEEAEPVGDDDMAFWLYTSGTTGAPKAAIHLHRDLGACRHYGVEVLGARDDDCVFATSKLFFAYALGNALLIPLFVGARTVLHPAWPDPETTAAVMRQARPTLFFSVPTFYARLLRADLPRDTFRSVRHAVSAGEALPAQIAKEWRDRFGVEILDGLGATETIFMVLSNRPGASRAGTVGTPVPGTEARLLDGEGREVADGEQGVLHVRTPSASTAYWRRRDQSRRAFIGEWFRTGDVCRRDADGYYHHCAREDDLFKVAGMWVAPADVEAALRSHPDVVDAGVIGAGDDGGLLKPVAFVVPAPAAGNGLEEALSAHVAQTLAAHQRPRRIVLVPELPRTATGKLQRYVLKQRAALER